MINYTENSEIYKIARQLFREGCIFQYFEDKNYDGRRITINKSELVNFASCSYLGLEKHNSLIRESIKAVKNYGTQVASPRAMLSSPLYKKLEDYISKIFPGFQIIAQTVTLAHCSVLPLLIREGDAIILDAYAHNSIRMAAQLCKVAGVFEVISKHNDIKHVEYLLYRLKKEGYKNIWYCADGVYSIHGNLCNINDLNKLLDKEENFYAYIDDAHGTGWCGKNGSGYVIGNFGLHNKMIVIESFAKSLVSSGAVIIVPQKELADFIRFTGQTMIFSGPIQPAILGGLIACLKFHLSDELYKYQSELMEIIKYFRNKSSELQLPIVTDDETPIQLLRIGNIEKTYELLKKLIHQGFFSMAAVYPAISKGDEGIRITLTRHIKKDDIDSFLKNISSFIKKNDLNH